MLIIGAGGHAREVADILIDQGKNDLVFFDEISGIDSVWERFPVISSSKQAQNLFAQDSRYIIATGHPQTRQLLHRRFADMGGSITSVIASTSQLSTHGLILGEGINVMHYSFLSCEVRLGVGTLINARANIHHGTQIGDYCEIGPCACLLGNVSIDDMAFIGAGATVLPKVKIGMGSIVGAGAVVTKEVPPYTLVAGIPARKVKSLTRTS